MEWYYVKVETSPGHFVPDFFIDEKECTEFFAKHPLNSAGFPYHWEAISKEEFEKRKAQNLRLPFVEYQAETA